MVNLHRELADPKNVSMKSGLRDRNNDEKIVGDNETSVSQ